MHQIGVNAVTIVGAFKDLFIVCKECSTSSKAFVETPIPKFDEPLLLQLCQDSIAFLRRTPAVVEIEAPVHIVGDVNGNIIDLIRVMSNCGTFSTNRYVFLGNFLGRGVFSVQCLALLLSMFCLCPQNIVILRGSNEFEENSTNLSFDEELREDYGPETPLPELFQEVFANLPLACLVGRQILCVHGGITQKMPTMNEIVTIRRPVYTLEDAIVADLVSANPSPAAGEYIDSEMTYDIDDFKQFMNNNKLRKLIRGHECVPKGVASSAGGKVLTVFSSGNHLGKKNKAGVIFINDEMETRGIAIGVVRLPKRAKAVWNFIAAPKVERKIANPRVFRQQLTAVKRAGSGKRRQNDPTGMVSQARRSSTLIVNTNPIFKPQLPGRSGASTPSDDMENTEPESRPLRRE